LTIKLILHNTPVIIFFFCDFGLESKGWLEPKNEAQMFITCKIEFKVSLALIRSPRSESGYIVTANPPTMDQPINTPQLSLEKLYKLQKGKSNSNP